MAVRHAHRCPALPGLHDLEIKSREGAEAGQLGTLQGVRGTEGSRLGIITSRL